MAISILTASLPLFTAGSPVSVALGAVGQTGPVVFSVTSGALPPGVTLTPDGIMSGVPSAGPYEVTISVSDSASPPNRATRTFFGSVSKANAVPGFAAGTAGVAPTIDAVAQMGEAVIAGAARNVESAVEANLASDKAHLHAAFAAIAHVINSLTEPVANEGAALIGTVKKLTESEKAALIETLGGTAAAPVAPPAPVVADTSVVKNFISALSDPAMRAAATAGANQSYAAHALPPVKA